MAFTAADVKNLREMTGVGMMDCKKALTASDGDMDKAVEFLREKGLAASAKKAGRVAAEFGKFPVVREYVDGSVGPDGAAGRFRRIVLQAGVVNVKHAGIFDETAGVGSKTFDRGDVVDGGLLACRN